MVHEMNMKNFEELTELLITDKIKRNKPPETRECFFQELQRIKEVDVLFEKLDDPDTTRRECKTT